MLGKAGHFSLVDAEVEVDAIDMEVNKGLLAFFAEEEGAVLVVVHEEVFGEDGGADGVAEEVEGGLYVGVAVGVVGAEAHAGVGGDVVGVREDAIEDVAVGHDGPVCSGEGVCCVDAEVEFHVFCHNRMCFSL